ncbi:MAG: GNAT family N-acetyltransferase [Armatimonadota bacterium]|nr:GNAT family N-acetyltransferase [Armatimonadota bacterium]
MISIAILATLSELEGLARDWGDLADHADSTVYQTYGWSIACGQFLPEPALLRVMAVRDQSGLVGLAPFYVVQRPGIRHLRLVGAAVISRQQAILARRGREREVAEALAEALLRDDGWDILDIRDVPAWATAVHHLQHVLARHGCEVRTAATREHRVIALPETFDAYLASLQAGFRRELHRVARRLREAGAVERVVTDAGERLQMLEVLFRLHHRRFADTGRRSTVTPRWMAFYRTLTERLGDCAVLNVLETGPDRAPVALDFSLVHGRHWHDRVASIDNESPLRRFSPGNVLKLALIRQAIERGCREFDMAFGHEPYKVRLGATPRPLTSVHVVAARARSRVAAAAWDLGRRIVRTSRMVGI